MKCSLLEDESYVKVITAKIPEWIAEGEKDLTDNRSVWAWLKSTYKHAQLSNQLYNGRKERKRNIAP